MACLTNKDMSKEPFATLAWAQFKREKKKKILDGKKNEITVCQREIDISGREGGRFFFFFLPSSFKTVILPRPGKATVKNSHKRSLKCPVCSQRGTLAHGAGNFFLPRQAGLLRDEDCAQRCEKPVTTPRPVPGKAGSGAVCATGASQ